MGVCIPRAMRRLLAVVVVLCMTAAPVMGAVEDGCYVNTAAGTSFFMEDGILEFTVADGSCRNAPFTLIQDTLRVQPAQCTNGDGAALCSTFGRYTVTEGGGDDDDVTLTAVDDACFARKNMLSGAFHQVGDGNCTLCQCDEAPRLVPDAVEDVAAPVVTFDSITVTFAPATEEDARVPTQTFRIELVLGDTVLRTAYLAAGPTTLQQTFDALERNTAYTIVIVATNTIGNSAAERLVVRTELGEPDVPEPIDEVERVWGGRVRFVAGAGTYAALGALAPPTPYTVEMWVQLEDVVLPSREYALLTVPGAADSEDWALVLSSGMLGVYRGAGMAPVAAPLGVVGGAPMHVAVTVQDGAAGDTIVSIFVEGVLHATGSLGAATPHGPTTWLIGKRGGRGQLAGSVDEVRVWSEARTASQLRSARFASLASQFFYDHDEHETRSGHIPPPPPPALYAYYAIDAVQGTELFEFVAARHGTLYGAATREHSRLPIVPPAPLPTWVLPMEQCFGVTVEGETPSPMGGAAFGHDGAPHVLGGGQLHAGGVVAPDAQLKLFRLDVADGEWANVPLRGSGGALRGRVGHTASAFANDQVLVVGASMDAPGSFVDDGKHIFLINAVDGTWIMPTFAGDVPSPRTQHSAVTVVDDMGYEKAVLFGGQLTSGPHSGELTADVFVYDEHVVRWRRVEAGGRAPTPRRAHSAAVWGESVFVFGGIDADGMVLADLYELNMETMLWREVPYVGVPPGPRAYATLEVLGSDLYLHGGAHSVDAGGLRVADGPLLRLALHGAEPGLALYIHERDSHGDGEGDDDEGDDHTDDDVHHHVPLPEWEVVHSIFGELFFNLAQGGASMESEFTRDNHGGGGGGGDEAEYEDGHATDPFEPLVRGCGKHVAAFAAAARVSDASLFLFGGRTSAGGQASTTETLVFTRGCDPGFVAEQYPLTEDGARVNTAVLAGQCTPCPPGTFGVPGAAWCAPCDPFSAQPHEGATSCLPCDNGFATHGGTQCTACRGGAEAVLAPHMGSGPSDHHGEGGEPVAAHCTCEVGFYDVTLPNTPLDNDCTLCNANGGDAPSSGHGDGEDEEDDHHQLVVTPDTLHCATCPAGAMCAGGDAAPVAAPGNFLTEKGFLVDCDYCDGNNECGDHRINDKCFDCEPGWYNIDWSCRECRMRDAFYVFIIGMPFAGVLLLLRFSGDAKERGATVFIVLAAMQIIGLMPRLLLEWPRALLRLLELTSFTNYNVQLFYIGCVGPTTHRTPFWDEWGIQLAVPWFFMCAFGITYAISHVFDINLPQSITKEEREKKKWHWYNVFRYRSKDDKRDYFLAAFVSFVDLCLIFVAVASLEVFACKDDPDGESFMFFRPNVSCDSDEWTDNIAWAQVNLIVFVIAYPLWVVYVLVVQGHRNKKFKDERFRLRYGPLFLRYNGVRTWWWKIVDIARRIAFVIILLFGASHDNIVMQTLGLLLLLFVYAAVAGYLQVYSASTSRRAHLVTENAVFLALLAGLIFAADAPRNDDQADLVEVITIVLLGVSMAVCLYLIFMEHRKRVAEEHTRRKLHEAGEEGAENLDMWGTLMNFDPDEGVQLTPARHASGYAMRGSARATAGLSDTSSSISSSEFSQSTLTSTDYDAGITSSDEE